MEQVSERLERLRQRRIGAAGVSDKVQKDEAPAPAPALRIARQLKPAAPVRQRFETRRVVKEEQEEEREGGEEVGGVQLVMPEVVARNAVVARGGPVLARRPTHAIVVEKDESALEISLGDILAAFAEKLVLGHTLILRKFDEMSYSISMGADVAITSGVEEMPQVAKELPKPKVKGTPAKVSAEYAEFLKWWRGMTLEQKVEWCSQNNVIWERSTAQLIDNMRMSIAAQVYLGVSKHA